MLSLLALILLSSDPSALWTEAARLEAAGQPSQAAKVLKPLTRQEPQNYAAQLQVAWLHFQAKEYEAAKRHYALALKSDPQSKVAKDGLAWTVYYLAWAEAARLEAAKKPAAAAEVLGPIVDRVPRDYAAQMRVAWLRFQAKDYAAAERRYTLALEVAPKSWEAKEGLAWSQYHLKKPKEATATLEGLAEDHPESLTRALRLASLHFQMRAYDKARHRYKRALSQDAKSYSAQAGLAWSLHYLKKPKEATRAVEGLTKLAPKSYTHSMQLAWMHFQMKAWPHAEKHYRAALAQSVKSFDARVGLAWSLFYQGEESESGDLFEALLEEKPADKSLLYGYNVTHPPWYWTLELGGTNHAYGKHPDVSDGFSGKASFTAANRSWLLQASFQRDQFHFEPLSKVYDDDRDEIAESDIEQGTFYGGVGYGGARFGIVLQGIYVSSNFIDPAPRGGSVTARWSPWGSINLTGALAEVSGERVTSQRLRWSMPVLDTLFAEPSVSLTQDIDGSLLLWGDLKLQYAPGPFSIFVSSGVGGHRNAFEAPSFYSLTGLMKWRGSGGGQLTFMDRYFVSAFVEMAGFESNDGTFMAEDHTVMWTGGSIGATFITQ